MPVPAAHRSINEIMYSEEELDVALFQPPLFKPIFPEDQDPVFNQYLGIVTGHAALMNDLGTEPNHGLLQLAAILIAAGIKTDVFDFHVLDIALRQGRRIISEDDFRDVIARKSARLYGISSKIVSASRAMRIAEIIKELHPGSTVVMGGVHPTFQATQILEQCRAVDVVVRGEADHAIVPLWRWTTGHGDLAEIPGVTFRDHDGVIVSSEKDLTQIDLDELPYAAYELVARETDPLVPRILTARGCTLRCVFCASAALFGYKFNSRHATRVVDQIEATRDRFGVEFVCMGDLTFMAHKPTGLAICRELIERDVGVRWSTQTTIGRIDPEAARLMAQSGCVQIGFGVESGSKLIIETQQQERAHRAGRGAVRGHQGRGHERPDLLGLRAARRDDRHRDALDRADARLDTPASWSTRCISPWPSPIPGRRSARTRPPTASGSSTGTSTTTGPAAPASASACR